MLSIIVPVYNVKDYLIKCLNSINNQTFKDYEVIVVDDGSTDGSGELVDQYCKDKDKFIVFHKENGGLMSAWKYGLEQSNGEYIGFVDSDDYIEVSMYEILYNKAIEKSADIVLCNHYYVNEKRGKTIHRNPISEGYYVNDQLEQIRKKMLPILGKDYISPSRCSKIIKRELITNCLKYTNNRISSAEDVNIMVPCMMICKSFVYIDKPLYYYVKRQNSISHVFRQEILNTYDVLIQNLVKCIKDVNYENKLKTEIFGLYNFYGILWAIYVADSNLNYSEKKVQINRIIKDIRYRSAVSLITKNDGKVSMSYKLMMKTGNIPVFLLTRKLMIFLPNR